MTTSATGPPPVSDPPLATAARGLGSPALRLLWAGQSASLIGDQVTVLALPLVALGTGASVGQVAVLTAATRAPFLLLGLPAGVWVGRIGLRRSMLMADVARAVTLASLPVAAAFSVLGYRQLLGVALALGCGAVLFQVAYQSLTPLLVDDADQLRGANTWLSASESVALIAGPAVAGLLVGTIGAVRALAVDAVSYLGSAGTLAALPAPADRPMRGIAPLRSEVRAGFRAVLHSPPLRAILFSSVLFNGGLAGYEALLVVFGISQLGLSPALLGLVVGLGGAGVPLGLLLSGPVERHIGVGPLLVLSAAFSGAGLIVTGAAAGPLAAPVIAAGTFITATGGGAWGLTALTTRQALSPPDMRAMTTAVHRWATYGVSPVGALLAGLCASALGPRPAILLSGAVALLAVIPLARSPLRRLRNLPRPAAAAPPPDVLGPAGTAVGCSAAPDGPAR